MSEIQEPPKSFFRILFAVGPGLIVAGSIVGSGELIATTHTGAKAGFSLLWLILIGCVIKVFAQIEFGRYAIISGKTTMTAMNEVPGPRIKGRGNWLVWYWLIMWFASIAQLGGIVGGVGQSLAISAPMTEQAKAYNAAADLEQRQQIDSYLAEYERRQGASKAEQAELAASNETAALTAAAPRETENYWAEYDQAYPVGEAQARSLPYDTVIWAAMIAVVTSVILVIGRYNLIQTFSTALVGSFTALVVLNVYWLQSKAEFAFSAQEFWTGMVPFGSETENWKESTYAALATFGIIGVGAAELVTYPYWCLEKGYAKFTGKNDNSQAWKARAKGWMRVMQVDAWGAMLIYTFSTIAFYVLGASVLHRVGLAPEKSDMVRTLAVMFQPVFSEWASMIFLCGAVAVLYSTFFVANASHARAFSDCLRVIGVIKPDEVTRQKWIRFLSGFFPILCLVIFIFIPDPKGLVLISGIAQGVMLPMLAGAALYFRYKRCVEELKPSTFWDMCLWLSALGMLITGTWTVYSQLSKWL
ncbi:manganese transport protein MntH [Stieleria bergensis]|uniref:Manganese transport protein MntH n=1 Tax=Stieleria bergensis TaxID=2528025 RepID=A0A517SXC3_9BACT|nr:manganese transport protein MntH [Planctomycetes bacterium SV_7m_r]